MRRPSVILIREVDEPTTGVRCVGRVRRELFKSHDPDFAARRQGMERMGDVYRMLRYRFRKDIDIEVIDPRNMMLLFVLVGEFVTHRVGLRTALRTLARLPPHAVLLNGRIVDQAAAPDIPAVVRLVAAALEGSPGAARVAHP